MKRIAQILASVALTAVVVGGLVQAAGNTSGRGVFGAKAGTSNVERADYATNAGSAATVGAGAISASTQFAGSHIPVDVALTPGTSVWNSYGTPTVFDNTASDPRTARPDRGLTCVRPSLPPEIAQLDRSSP